MTRLFVHTALSADEVFLRYRGNIARIQPATGDEHVPAGADNVFAIDAHDDSLGILLLQDADITIFPTRFSPKALADKTTTKLKHLGLKKGATAYDALDAIYAATGNGAFHPELGH